MDWKNGKFGEYYRDLYNLPPSAKFVLYILSSKGAISRKELIDQTLLSSRTIGHALRVLLEEGYIKKEKLKKKHRRHKVDKRIVKYALREAFN